MTTGDLDSDTGVTFEQGRLDRLADALGAQRVRPGAALLPLWHWVSAAAECAPGTSVLIRVFRAPQAGLPGQLKQSAQTPADTWNTSGMDLLQQGQLRVQTLTSLLLTPEGDSAPRLDPDAKCDALASPLVRTGQLLELFGEDFAGGRGSAENRVLAMLAADRLRRQAGRQLVAVLFNFWSAPRDPAHCQWTVRLHDDGRAQYCVGVPGQPAPLTGTAWFGCGPGSAR